MENRNKRRNVAPVARTSGGLNARRHTQEPAHKAGFYNLSMNQTETINPIVKTLYQGLISISFISFLHQFTAGDFQAISAGISALGVMIATIYKIRHDIKREEAKNAKEKPPEPEPD